MSLGSLRLRLLVGAAAFVLAALALSALGLTALFERHVTRWLDGELSNHLEQLIAGIDKGMNGELRVARPPADPRFQNALSGLYWQVDVEPSGPVLRSRSLWDFEMALPAESSTDDDMHHYRLTGPGEQTLYVIQRRIELPTRLGGEAARVAVAIDEAYFGAAVRRFTGALLPFLGLLTLLLTAAAWAQVTIGLRPLATVRRKLAAIGSGDKRRLGNDFPDEVKPLAEEIDALLDERERQITKARDRAADLAHGLKTPLQVLSAEAERLNARGETEIANVIEEICTTMRRHVERELTRARSGANHGSAATEIATVAQRVVRVMERTPEGKRITWTIDMPPGIKARIDPEDLTEALGNLTENAARHARSAVTIRARPENGAVVISVLDDGPGIPPSRANEVLRRGGRLDASGSAGLGLAIVGDIADAWGGTLSVEVPERGCHISLRLLSPAPGAQSTHGL
ncbi:MAG TPA: HAMP domain-containing sensor histidine kinase [Hyphomicrobium sp.]|nr:HAMP domain-containing sensor histidine kinase [Hyphomicrobium sp.]